MAFLLQLTVAPATQDQFNELDAKVGQSMREDVVVRPVWSFAALRSQTHASTPRGRASR